MATSTRRGKKRQVPTGVGVIGLGFMGRTHLAAYRDADAAGFANRIVAIADRGFDAKGRKRRKDTSTRGNLDTGDDGGPLFDPETTALYPRAEDLFEDDTVELVSICTHTPTHVDLAVQALQAGKHVLVEKPIALSAKDVRRLARAASKADTLCMPAMCIRFWPAWAWLRTAIREERYGPVESAVFRRLASHPGWSTGFYGDSEQSGGALFDLHIHDADFVQACFGAPHSVSTTGTVDHVTTLYRYEDGPVHVVAEGGWNHAPGFGFEMNFTVVFRDATADFRLDRDPNLVLWKGNRASHPKIATWNGYEGEVRHLLRAIRKGDDALDATMDDAAQVTRMLEAERKSLEKGRAIRVGS